MVLRTVLSGTPCIPRRAAPHRRQLTADSVAASRNRDGTLWVHACGALVSARGFSRGAVVLFRVWSASPVRSERRRRSSVSAAMGCIVALLQVVRPVGACCKHCVVLLRVASTPSCRRSWFGEATKIVSGAMEMAQLLDKGATVLVCSARHRNRRVGCNTPGNMQHCSLQHAAGKMQRATRDGQHATDNAQRATRDR